MSILTTVSESDATGLVAELYDADIAGRGHVTPYTKVMVINPDSRALHALAVELDGASDLSPELQAALN